MRKILKPVSMGLFILVLFFLFDFFIPQQVHPPQNIILMIGDGMGISQITAAKIIKGTINFERFKSIGLLTTSPQDVLVTDSAAGGTALATGHKTSNGVIAQSPDGKIYKTVLEYATDKKMATGVVVTCTITHATPACFLSHTKSRQNMAEIAKQIAESRVDVLIGGGWQYFLPNTINGGVREDGQNYLKVLGQDRVVVRSLDSLRILDEQRFVALIAPQHLPKAADRDYSEKELVNKALTALSKNTNGFFLMVEGSQIDWGGHANDSDYIVNEMLDFDDAVRAALDFAEKDGNTLVVVTADHETGGYAILDGSLKDKTITKTGFVTDHHTDAMVGVFAYGPGEEAFRGIQDNTTVGKTLIDYVIRL